MREYTVLTDCEIARVWREKGSSVWLTDDQARELAPPLGGTISLKIEPVEEDTDVGLGRNKRDNRKAAD